MSQREMLVSSHIMNLNHYRLLVIFFLIHNSCLISCSELSRYVTCLDPYRYLISKQYIQALVNRKPSSALFPTCFVLSRTEQNRLSTEINNNSAHIGVKNESFPRRVYILLTLPRGIGNLVELNTMLLQGCIDFRALELSRQKGISE